MPLAIIALSKTVALGHDSLVVLGERTTTVQFIPDVAPQPSLTQNTYIQAQETLITPANSQTNNKMASQPTGFLSLPAELRNEIYAQVLEALPDADSRSIARRVKDGCLRPYHGFIRVHPTAPGAYHSLRLQRTPRHPGSMVAANRQMLQEVSDIFLGTRDMHITTTIREVAVVAGYLRRVITNVGSSPFASLTINIVDATWQQLEDLQPLIDVVRATNFRVDHTFHLLSRGASPGVFAPNLATTLQRAMGLGVTARQQGWDEARLQQEVRRWADGERQSDAGVEAADARREQRIRRPRGPWYEAGKRRKRRQAQQDQ